MLFLLPSRSQQPRFWSDTFLVVNYCSTWSRHLLSHFLVRGGAYVLNHDTLHGQLFGHIPVHLSTGQHPTRDSALTVTPELSKLAAGTSAP